MYTLRLQYKKGHPMNLIAKLLMNSLYGKFGMRMETTVVEMHDTSTDDRLQFFKERLDALGESITDYIKIDKTYVIVRDSKLAMKYDDELDMYHGVDVNIAVASAITAGARVHMSIFKKNPDFNLYYSDTDSAVVDAQLPIELVGSALGQMKLEYTINKAIFLAPKVYGLVDVDGNEIIKVKGISHDVASQLHIEDLESLLVKDSTREFTQEKWFKKQIEGEISILDTMYTLQATSNKRAPLYIYDDGVEIYSNTRPYNYDEITSNN
jgi:hypothetical protein